MPKMSGSEHANEILLALNKRKFEQITFAGFLKCLAGNKLEITEERIQPYIDAVNEATKNLWRALWNAHNDGFAYRPNPGKAPIVKYNKKMRCDGRCQNATGFQCECSCGGANHGITNIALALGSARTKVSTETIRELRNQRKEEAKENMREINNTPQASLSIQMHKADRQLLRA